MTEAAEALKVTRSALYPYAAWEGDHWLLVAAPRLRDGVVVTPPPIDLTGAAAYDGSIPAARYQEVSTGPYRAEGEAMGQQPLTVAEVAEELRVSAAAVRDWITRGELEAYQLPSGAWRIEREAIEELKARGRRSRAEG